VLHADFVWILANILGLTYFFITHPHVSFLADLWHRALPKPDDDAVDAIVTLLLDNLFAFVDSTEIIREYLRVSRMGRLGVWRCF
jgi:hypothetical protein